MDETIRKPDIGATIRVDDGDDVITPPFATFSFHQVTAEDWEIAEAEPEPDETDETEGTGT